MIQMVGSTCGTLEGFTHGQTSGSQQPPPPPPNLAEVMALQTELLRQLVQGQQNQPRLSNEDVMIMFLQHLGIRISLVPSPRCFTRPMSPQMQIHGFGPQSQNSPYCQYHAPKQTRPSSPPNNYVAVGVYQRHLAMTPADANLGWQYFMNHE